jgi:hypothetical protein
MEMVEVYRLADEGVAFEFIVSLIVGDGFEQAIICAVLTRKCAWVNPVQTVGNGGGFFLQQGIPSRKHFTNFIILPTITGNEKDYCYKSNGDIIEKAHFFSDLLVAKLIFFAE